MREIETKYYYHNVVMVETIRRYKDGYTDCVSLEFFNDKGEFTPNDKIYETLVTFMFKQESDETDLTEFNRFVDKELEKCR
jgi:hypothetical protein